MKYFNAGLLGLGLSFVTLTGCMPDHFSKFDGQSVDAQFEGFRGQTVDLKGAHGESFRLGRDLKVWFDVSRFGDSSILVADGQQTARINVPKSVLNQEGPAMTLSSQESGQWVDFRMKEGMRVLSSWTAVRHTQTPRYMTVCSSNGRGGSNCHQMFLGYNDHYYRDDMGWVDRTLDAEIFEKGASQRAFPEEMKLGVVHALVTHRVEELGTTPISYTTYMKESRSTH